MRDLRYRLSNYRARAVDVYRREGVEALVRKGASFSWLLLGTPYWVLRYGSGTSILDCDWDNCLLFDACRYDVFRQLAPYDEATISQRTTLGSNTVEFLARTFKDVRLHDTVYVTANPKFFKQWDQLNPDGPVFHDTISLLDDWDPEVNTVPPGAVVERALQASESYPNKRLLVHFIQPHTPFLGPTADAIRRRTGKTIGGLRSVDGTARQDGESQSSRFPSYVDALNAGIAPETIRTAYRETLERLIEECQSLVDALPGKTVITADHGEHLGDRPVPFGGPLWGHPPGVRSRGLRIVPWVEFGGDERKPVSADQPKLQESLDRQLVNDRLRDLGYR